ncbi:ribonuclease HII [Cyclobacterium amurskyense]|jgi:ribonuclease HII|uniref:Ribonuclease HII n=1 Tax=Cyclobacterium amurskyense TaxID=320787 RepID=A0A0H4PI64_9BACT|nr:ribonuclease HII [Cyclobacterium amurskyense]AKP52735.1 Ribonuclease HII [Cyclobacterium amurskyense]|tara:strand:- start:5120 stop:5701 length:582 start_codon:yes stop_codon:yes gene_type:complete
MLLPNLVPNRLEAGCDEVGRGCLCGPVTAAAVILPEDYANEWINDSKKLTKGNREKLTEEIKANSLTWAIASATVEEIDEINILNASFLAMNRAIEALKIKPEFLLIDGNRFNPIHDIPYECIIKGDGKYASIAAASILAKTYRDDLMANLAVDFPGYGWEKNVGYPTKSHRLGIKEFGPTPHHRQSFKLLPE